MSIDPAASATGTAEMCRQVALLVTAYQTATVRGIFEVKFGRPPTEAEEGAMEIELQNLCSVIGKRWRKAKKAAQAVGGVA